MTSTTFIHTADWQLGKPFARIEDDDKRRDVQKARLDAITRIGEVAREHGAAFILVAGDLFDSPTTTRSTVSQACSLIGALDLPVYAIPGNHDHGGPGGLWDQDFFNQERDQLAPNLHILLEPTPVETDEAVLLPCPLRRRHETSDPMAWLQSVERPGSNDQKPRIVIAHGSVQGFDNTVADANDGAGTPNLLDLTRFAEDTFDYIALGDWHGTKQIGPRAWYSGTPEIDRFKRGEGNDPGNILVIRTTPGEAPEVCKVATRQLGWHRLEFRFTEDASLDQFGELLGDTLGNRAGRDLLELELSGSLGIEATARLEELLETFRSRLLRLKLVQQTTIAPTPEEVEELTRRSGDPLISRVAGKLIAKAAEENEESATARLALRELYSACHSNNV